MYFIFQISHGTPPPQKKNSLKKYILYIYTIKQRRNQFLSLQAVDKVGSGDLPETVHNIMNTWVLQMGFPVVTINATTGVISQKHFLLDPDSEVTAPSPFKYELWSVIIVFRISPSKCKHITHAIIFFNPSFDLDQQIIVMCKLCSQNLPNNTTIFQKSKSLKSYSALV